MAYQIEKYLLVTEVHMGKCFGSYYVCSCVFVPVEDDDIAFCKCQSFQSPEEGMLHLVFSLRIRRWIVGDLRGMHSYVDRDCRSCAQFLIYALHI